MYAIKSIGRQVIDIILTEREANGKYTTLSDFLSRVAGREVNKRAVENLIKAGACDGLDGNRQQMLLVYNTLIDNLNQEKKNSLAGQMSLFDLVSEEEKRRMKSVSRMWRSTPRRSNLVLRRKFLAFI